MHSFIEEEGSGMTKRQKLDVVINSEDTIKKAQTLNTLKDTLGDIIKELHFFKDDGDWKQRMKGQYDIHHTKDEEVGDGDDHGGIGGDES